jgi:hypothetical protein
MPLFACGVSDDVQGLRAKDLEDVSECAECVEEDGGAPVRSGWD